MGSYAYFRILDARFDLDYVYKIAIGLQSHLGDADLFVSTSADNPHPTVHNYTLASRRNDKIDQVELTDTLNAWLPDQIYIGVFAETYVEYELEVTVEYHPTQN